MLIGGDEMSKVVVIGAGPAGIMAAITAAKKNKVILVEKNEKIGKKLFITGKGRCNITNAKNINDFFDYIPGNPSFLYSALYTFTNEDTMSFFDKHGVKLKVERGDRVFPESDKSSDIINALHNELINSGVTLSFKSAVKKVYAEGDVIKHIELQDNSIIEGDYFIFCTGGLSYPRTGSTGEGLTFAKELGHKIIEPKPSLVPIVIEDEWVKELQGLSLKNVELKITNNKNKKTIYKEFGEMLFTHFGISGPIVLSASSVVDKNLNLSASINLKPALSYEELDKRIQKDFLLYANKSFKNALNDLFPSKLINVFVKLSGINEDKKVNLITREERKALIILIQNFSMKISGLRPIEEAIVTAGGVDTKQIDPSTMNSKLIKNMYFAGEVIDVDAFTGGYNIQIALSTGFIAGSKVGEN